MTPGAAGPPGIGQRAAFDPPPPAWLLPFAWTGALVFVLSLAYFVYCYQFRFGRVVPGAPQLRPIVIDVALFTIFAAHHSVFARAGVKAMLRRVVHPAVERSVFTWIASLLFMTVCWQWQPVAGVAYRIPDPWAWIGYGVQLAGLLLAARASKVLDVLDLAGVRLALDARTERPAREAALVSDGVYGVVRHPIYLGWALLVFGAPQMTATRLVFAIVSTAYLALAIPLEERGLVRELGPGYDEYRRRVRWRMIPGLY